jgi:magnesium-transporting ATPase (P-type)
MTFNYLQSFIQFVIGGIVVSGTYMLAVYVSNRSILLFRGIVPLTLIPIIIATWVEEAKSNRQIGQFLWVSVFYQLILVVWSIVFSMLLLYTKWGDNTLIFQEKNNGFWWSMLVATAVSVTLTIILYVIYPYIYLTGKSEF